MLLIFGDPIYLILYCALATSAVLNSFHQDCQLKAIVYLETTILLMAVIAFRWKIGTDWDSYYAFFQGILTGSGSADEKHFDVGYAFINYISSAISNSYTFLLISTTLLSTGLLSFLLYRFSSSPYIGQLIFLGSYLPIHFIGSIRRSIAITFACTALIMAIEFKKRAVSYLSLLFAFLQHNTAIISVAFYFIPKKRFTKKTTIILILITVIFGLFNISEILLQLIGQIMPNESDINILITVGNYAGEAYKEHTPETINPILISSLSIVKKVVFLFIFELGLHRKSSSIDDMMYNIYVIGVAIYSVFIGAPIVQVIAVYFLVFEVLLISRIWNRLKPIEKGVFLPYILISSFLAYDSGLSVYPDIFFPYISIF